MRAAKPPLQGEGGAKSATPSARVVLSLAVSNCDSMVE